MIIAAVGLLYSLLKENTQLKVINSLIMTGFIVLYSGNLLIAKLGGLLISFSLFAYILYVVRFKPHDFLGHLFIISGSVFAGLIPLLYIIDWPGSFTLRSLAILPVLAGALWFLISKKIEDSALSPAIILSGFCLIHFIMITKHW